MENNKKLN